MIKIKFIARWILCLASGFCVNLPIFAATDIEAQDGLARARAKNQMKGMDHSAHQMPVDPNKEFHGVFYGYLPCDDCDGVKTTLSLTQNNNYLLVTQPARESIKEYYERGKYVWNENERSVTLTPKKAGEKAHRYSIRDAGTLVQVNEDGSSKGDDDRYILQRSDVYKSREVHIH